MNDFITEGGLSLCFPPLSALGTQVAGAPQKELPFFPVSLVSRSNDTNRDRSLLPAKATLEKAAREEALLPLLASHSAVFDFLQFLSFLEVGGAVVEFFFYQLECH